MYCRFNFCNFSGIPDKKPGVEIGELLAKLLLQRRHHVKPAHSVSYGGGERGHRLTLTCLLASEHETAVSSSILHFSQRGNGDKLQIKSFTCHDGRSSNCKQNFSWSADEQGGATYMNFILQVHSESSASISIAQIES
eukprot:761732-Hanusia_phi.AAC.2